MLLKHWKRTIAWALAFALMLTLVPISALAAGGNGTEEHPYLISSLTELEAFRDSVNSGNTGAGEYFKLTSDIDMSAKYNETTGLSWEMIGARTYDPQDEFQWTDHPFKGTFDGAGHTIRGLYINKTGPGNEYYGFDAGALFEIVEGGTIQNLNVKGSVSVAAESGEAAGIAVCVRDGAIVSCTFDGTVECPNYLAAGIAAECENSLIADCKASGRITGMHLTAGIAGTGIGTGGTITNCVNESEIIATSPAGGIAGAFEGKIEGCVNRGSVTGRTYVWRYEDENGPVENRETSFAIGGIAGMSSNSGTVENCLNTGAVSGNTEVGGILGRTISYSYEGQEYFTSMKNCLNTGRVTSTNEADGEHYLGLVIGTVVSEAWGDDIQPGTADVVNCYYLARTAEKGIAVCNDGVDTTTAKTAGELASGEVAYLLQEGNGGNTSATVWGQKLADDEVPVLTDNTEKAVYQLTFMADDAEYAMKYANPSGPATLPDNPTKSGYTFGGWCKEDACTNVWDFGADPVTEDMTLYAKWTKNDPKPTPTPTPAPVPSPAPGPDGPVITVEQFADVKPDAWYYGAVKYAVDSGLFYGTSDITFSPDGNMTRGMLATVLYRLAKEPEAISGDLFNDVADGKYYTEAIAWAAENKIVSGYGNNRFGPEDSITREQLATILWRYAGSPESTGGLDEFTDRSKTAKYAVPALQWAVEQKIVSGKGNGILDPTGKATRAEVATMLMRYCEKF